MTVCRRISLITLSLVIAMVLNIMPYQTYSQGTNPVVYLPLIQTDFPPLATTANLIPIEGGSVPLANYATVTFPSNSFKSSHLVKIEATNYMDTANVFTETTAIFRAFSNVRYEIRINTGAQQPSKTSRISLTVPESLTNLMLANTGIDVFAQIWQDGGEELLDNFEIIDSTFDPLSKTVSANIIKEVYSNRRNSASSFEAVITLALTPGASVQTMNVQQQFMLAQSNTGCQAASFDNPLDKAIEVSGNPPRYFNAGGVPHPITGVTTAHLGVDLKAAVGDSVLAVADGVIEKVDFQLNQKTKTGWGQYVVLRHQDGSATLYAHLKKGSPLKQGARVSRGDKIAEAGDTGGVTGPHLHLEYAPNGEIYNKKSKVDPFSCIGKEVVGSISVADIGPMYDDIFEVVLNDKVLGRTVQGGANSFAASNLRPGTYTLSVKCIVDGTKGGAAFGVTLANGLKFSNGATSIEGLIFEGGSASYIITVPSN